MKQRKAQKEKTLAHARYLKRFAAGNHAQRSDSLRLAIITSLRDGLLSLTKGSRRRGRARLSHCGRSPRREIVPSKGCRPVQAKQLASTGPSLAIAAAPRSARRLWRRGPIRCTCERGRARRRAKGTFYLFPIKQNVPLSIP